MWHLLLYYFTIIFQIPPISFLFFYSFILWGQLNISSTCINLIDHMFHLIPKTCISVFSFILLTSEFISYKNLLFSSFTINKISARPRFGHLTTTSVTYKKLKENPINIRHCSFEKQSINCEMNPLGISLFFNGTVPAWPQSSGWNE